METSYTDSLFIHFLTCKEMTGPGLVHALTCVLMDNPVGKPGGTQVLAVPFPGWKARSPCAHPVPVPQAPCLLGFTVSVSCVRM